jgi:two-component system sensor histidine kinase KdpD
VTAVLSRGLDRRLSSSLDGARLLDATAPIRYGCAALIAVASVLGKIALDHVGLDTGFLLLIPAVVVSALLGGVGPGVLATAITGAVAYLSLDPVMQIGIADPGAGANLLLFTADGLILSWLAGSLRESVRSLSISRAQADLEHGRTALLQDVTSQVAGELDPAAIAAAVLGRSSELVGCDRGWIVVATADGSVKVLGALHGPKTTAPADDDAAATALAARAIADGMERWIQAGTPAHEELSPEPMTGLAATTALAVVPLRRADGSVFGALIFAWSVDHELRPANRDLKRAIAGITAQALERARLSAEQASQIAALAEREVVRDAFLAVLSHELRTPVTTIYGASALLIRQQSPTDGAGLAHDIHDEAERLRRIVDDLLVLSRSERGAIEVSPEPVLVQRTVAEVVGRIRRRHPAAVINISADEHQEAALADPTALNQVVANLVSNAVKYAGDAGPIDVSVRQRSADVLVTVDDRGPGLGDAPETVFQLFHRAEHTRRRASGSGIGLYVARELVWAMGGEIGGSNRPDGGATFSFTLPLEDPETNGPRKEGGRRLAG